MSGSAPSLAVVGFDLQVVVAPDEDGWIAQGVQIDCAAGGDTPEDAQKRFEHALGALLQAHLTNFGNLDKVLSPVNSANVWAELAQSAAASEWTYSHVSVHELLPAELDFFPFETIKYAQVQRYGQSPVAC